MEPRPFRDRTEAGRLLAEKGGRWATFGRLVEQFMGLNRFTEKSQASLTGFSILAPHIVYGPARKSDEERSRILGGYSAPLREIEAESPYEVGSY